MPACRCHAEIDRSHRERRAQEDQAALARVSRKALPLLRRELHSPPIVEACRVLLREAHSERLIQGQLGRGNMGLEFDRVGAGIGDRIDERMREPERAVMRLRDLGDDESFVARPNAAAGDLSSLSRAKPVLDEGVHLRSAGSSGVIARALTPYYACGTSRAQLMEHPKPIMEAGNLRHLRENRGVGPLRKWRPDLLLGNAREFLDSAFVLLGVRRLRRPSPADAKEP